MRHPLKPGHFLDASQDENACALGSVLRNPAGGRFRRKAPHPASDLQGEPTSQEGGTGAFCGLFPPGKGPRMPGRAVTVRAGTRGGPLAWGQTPARLLLTGPDPFPLRTMNFPSAAWSLRAPGMQEGSSKAQPHLLGDKQRPLRVTMTPAGSGRRGGRRETKGVGREDYRQVFGHQVLETPGL